MEKKIVEVLRSDKATKKRQVIDEKYNVQVYMYENCPLQKQTHMYVFTQTNVYTVNRRNKKAYD